MVLVDRKVSMPNDFSITAAFIYPMEDETLIDESPMGGVSIYI